MSPHRQHFLLESIHDGQPMLGLATSHELRSLVGLVIAGRFPGVYRLTESGQLKLAAGRLAIERAYLEGLVNRP